MGPVGLPVGEPPAGSRVTASVSAPASALARNATVPLPPGRRPSERGAPLLGTAHSSSERSACTDTATIGRATRLAPSPLMLATIAGAEAPAGPVAVAS